METTEKPNDASSQPLAKRARRANRRAAGPPRERLLAAMVELVGEQGYAETTVAHVIERAGASRRTFYVHFKDREDCFLQATEEIADRWVQRTRESIEQARGGSEEPIEAFVGAIFQDALANPSAVRMLAVELAATGRPGIAYREGVFAQLGDTLARAMTLQHETELASSNGHGKLVPETLAGAIVRIPFARSLRGERVRRPRRSELLALVPGVAQWTATYGTAPPPQIDSSSVEPPPVGGRAPGTLSLGGHTDERLGLPRRDTNPSRSFVAHNQRERLLDALTNLSARKGYQAVTIPDIVSEAGVSVETFYEHFDGREDMLRVAYEIGRRKVTALVERAYHAQEDWSKGVRAAIHTMLSFLASEPSFAHLALVDVPAAGGKLAALPHANALFYADIFKGGLAHSGNGRQLPEIAAEASARALHELCYSRVAAQGAHEMLELGGLVMHVALAPFGATAS